MQINTLINHFKPKFDKFYNDLLIKKLNESILAKAMKYGAMNGGKRIRPFLVYESSKIVKLSNFNSMIVASSIESIHAYSLIHDDLPSMDDDDYRRGKFSTHKKFNEATAILAGDALHDLAFEIIANELKKVDAKINLKLLNYLSICTGLNGLAGGQSLDLLYENQKLNERKILNMYRMKTGKLFEFSFAAPFIIAGSSYKNLNFAKEYGLLFGLVFQIIDDLLDEINSFEIIGKTPGKDKKQGKGTLHSIVGKEKVITYCQKLVDKFIKKYRQYFLENPTLAEMLNYNFNRLK